MALLVLVSDICSAATLQGMSADEVVISFRQEHQLAPGFAAPPLLRVYADGRVQVNRPSYMKEAGTFETRIKPRRLERLLTRLERRGLERFERRLVDEECDRILKQRGELFVVTDETISEITVAWSREDGTRVSKRLRMPNVDVLARRFPQIRALANLDAVQTELFALERESRRAARRERALDSAQ